MPAGHTVKGKAGVCAVLPAHAHAGRACSCCGASSICTESLSVSSASCCIYWRSSAESASSRKNNRSTIGCCILEKQLPAEPASPRRTGRLRAGRRVCAVPCFRPAAFLAPAAEGPFSAASAPHISPALWRQGTLAHRRHHLAQRLCAHRLPHKAPAYRRTDPAGVHIAVHVQLCRAAYKVCGGFATHERKHAERLALRRAVFRHFACGRVAPAQETQRPYRPSSVPPVCWEGLLFSGGRGAGEIAFFAEEW